MIYLRLRCDSQADFIRWAKVNGLIIDLAKPGPDGETTRLTPGFDYVEIGVITQVQAVTRGGKDAFELITPATVDTAYHVDCRIFGDAETNITKGLAQTKVVTVNDNGVSRQVIAPASIFDRTSLGVAMKVKAPVAARVVNGLKVAPGYRDPIAGVALIEPATSRHEWC